MSKKYYLYKYQSKKNTNTNYSYSNEKSYGVAFMKKLKIIILN